MSFFYSERQEAAARLAAKYHAALVHFQKVFDDACKLAPPITLSGTASIPPIPATS